MAVKVLVVEDEPLMADLLIEKLRRVGFDAILAVDGESGINALKKNLFDVILLDLILPGVGGFEVLEKVKADPRTKNIPVIILSNLGSGDEVKKGLRMGADTYLIKANVTTDDIVAAVRKTLEKIRAS